MCNYIKDHTKVADKIKPLLKVGDANALLSTKNNCGKTPLQITAEEDASNEIKNLLTPQSNSNSTNKNKNKNNSSSKVDLVEGSDIPVKKSNQNQQTTLQSSSSINNGPNYQAQLNTSIVWSIYNIGTIVNRADR